MKKTLITLLALGGLALGADAITNIPSVAVYKNASDITLPSDTLSWTGGITIALTLDDSYLKTWATNDATGTYQIFYMKGITTSGSTNYNQTIGLKFLRESSTSAKITGCWNATNANADNTANQYGKDNATELEDLTLMSDSLESASIVYMFGGSSTDAQVVLTLGYSDDTTKQYSYTLTGYKCGYWATQPNSIIDGHKDLVDGITVYGTRLDVDMAKSVGIAVLNQAIPEPTTATLSLLALAGLAMRRRRK